MLGVGTEADPPLEGLSDWYVAEITDSAAIHAAVSDSGADGIVHLAGQASAGLSFQDAERTFHVNVLGTWYLLEAVGRHAPGARVLIVGSGEAYGPQTEGTRVSESAPFRPVSPYALSKAVVDEVSRALHRVRGLDIVRTRSFSHAGPGQSARFAMPSFALQIAALEREGEGGALRVGNLEVVRDVLDVRDVVDCYMALFEIGVPGRAYNVCSGVGVPLTHLLDLLIGMARVPVNVEVDPGRVRPADVPYLVGDPARVITDTGWRPKHLLETTLEDLLEQCRQDPQEV